VSGGADHLQVPKLFKGVAATPVVLSRIIEFMDFFHRPIKTKPKRLKITTFRNLVLISSSGKK
jgi:hypothetical protein